MSLKNKKVERESHPDEKYGVTDFEAALASHPWLERYLSKSVAGTSSAASAGASSSSHHDRLSVADAELDDATVEAIFSELEKKRAEWRLDPKPGLEHFRYTVQGGQWTMANRGVVVDSVKAHACGKEIAEWCVAWGLPRSLTLSFAKYSEQVGSSIGYPVVFCAAMSL